MLLTNRHRHDFLQLHTSLPFSYLAKKDFEQLVDHTIFREYKKGQIIFFEGDSRDRVFYLKTGLIRLERQDATANFYYIDYIKHDTFFPYGNLFVEKTQHTYTAYASTDIQLYAISMSVFESLTIENQPFLLFAYRNLAKILAYQELRLRNIVTSSATERIVQALALWMVDLGEKNSDGTITIPYPMTLIELARISGTTRETAGSVVKHLKEHRLIKYEHKILTYLDVAHFQEYVS